MIGLIKRTPFSTEHQLQMKLHMKFALTIQLNIQVSRFFALSFKKTIAFARDTIQINHNGNYCHCEFHLFGTFILGETSHVICLWYSGVCLGSRFIDFINSYLNSCFIYRIHFMIELKRQLEVEKKNSKTIKEYFVSMNVYFWIIIKIGRDTIEKKKTKTLKCSKHWKDCINHQLFI